MHGGMGQAGAWVSQVQGSKHACVTNGKEIKQQGHTSDPEGQRTWFWAQDVCVCHNLSPGKNVGSRGCASLTITSRKEERRNGCTAQPATSRREARGTGYSLPIINTSRKAERKEKRLDPSNHNQQQGQLQHDRTAWGPD